MKLLLTLICLLALLDQSGVAQKKGSPAKARTIVTTDGEVDDVDTFIRMLLYSNEFTLVGLVYSSSQWHYKGDGKGTKFTSEMANTAERYGERTDLRWPGTTWMDTYIDKYAQVYPNLIKHASGYPTPTYLKSLVRVGNIDFEGEMSQDTEGSDFIKNVLLDNDPSPVYLQIWGGTNTVARALKSIEDQYKHTPQWAAIQKKVADKAVIYAVLDQDATYRKYVAPNWPKIRVLYNSDQFWSFAYLWPRVVPTELQTYLKGDWFAKYIKFGHGPLLSSYYLWGDGQQLAGDPEHTHGDPAEAKKYNLSQYDFISEGDSPAYFYLIDVGLRSLENVSYGGWGGRMVQSKANPYRWEDGKTVTDYDPYTKKQDAAYPQTRWIPVLQNDFAARADWCVKSYREANHAPVVKLNHARDLRVKAGQTITLSGSATDPDNDKLTYRWWPYTEAGTYPAAVVISQPNQPKASLTIPADATSGQTMHLILEVTDAGTPSLTRYQRVIATVY
ncbi:DUF1593 domain-containing protein [Fibrivirga algicola]|uniref:DUF1593 domain-containing protein n=1 Tax=Fibrivirga algicola TaxID=2950420 RepID=A0ABX0QC85_9BACT|nr:nucleoside hydrolase-like domain-containing protein [Fibrivirga algicola]NID08677.1 DUF1593 domain-containing protein [Fibrivirga algicola]